MNTETCFRHSREGGNPASLNLVLSVHDFLDPRVKPEDDGFLRLRKMAHRGRENLNTLSMLVHDPHGPRIKSGVTDKKSVGHPQNRLKNGQLKTAHNQDERARRSSSAAVAQSKKRLELVMETLTHPGGISSNPAALSALHRSGDPREMSDDVLGSSDREAIWEMAHPSGESLNTFSYLIHDPHGPRIKSGVTKKESVGHPQSRLKDGQLEIPHNQDEGAKRLELIMETLAHRGGFEPPTP